MVSIFSKNSVSLLNTFSPILKQEILFNLYPDKLLEFNSDCTEITDFKNKKMILGSKFSSSQTKKKSLVSCATNFFFRFDIGEKALDWLCVKLLAFDWLREMFDVT